MAHTLVVVRHAKSDWSVLADDRDRPLATRGRRQAPAVGHWLAGQGLRIDLAVVSIAQRARSTWDLVARELGDPLPTTQEAAAAYTFDGDALVDLVCALPESAGTVALVGHNPAVEELVESLTGVSAAMPTAAVAVIDLEQWSRAGDGRGVLRAAGRPADGPLALSAP